LWIDNPKSEKSSDKLTDYKTRTSGVQNEGAMIQVAANKEVEIHTARHDFLIHF